MSNESFSFKIGNFECTAISDGTYSYPHPAPLLFANTHGEHLERVLAEYGIQPKQWIEWTSPYTCLLINTGEHRVLVDTGTGYSLDENTGKLLQNMEAEGISPREIDMVIITHAHPDHIGGNTINDDEIAFPNARFFMWKDEWDFWTSSRAEQKLSEHFREELLEYAHRNLPPIQSQLELIDHEIEIAPGIQTIAAQGHTPGHMALSIVSEGERLLYISDAVLHPIHVEQPEWYSAVDINPEQTVATRYRLLKKATEGKTLILAFHFPFFGLGHITRKEGIWKWQPVK